MVLKRFLLILHEYRQKISSTRNIKSKNNCSITEANQIKRPIIRNHRSINQKYVDTIRNRLSSVQYSINSITSANTTRTYHF